jgi:hypothetical protein
MVGYLHLAPGIEVKELMPDGGVLADDTGLSANLAFFGVDSVDIVPGWYCPAFGERIRANVVRYRKQLAQSNRLGWILCVKNSKFRPSMRFRGNDCEIEFGPTNYSFSLELN